VPGGDDEVKPAVHPGRSVLFERGPAASVAQAIAERMRTLGDSSKGRVNDILTGVKLPVRDHQAGDLAAALGGSSEEVAGAADLYRRIRQERPSRPAAPPSGTKAPATRPGRPITDCDPLQLEVQPAIEVPGQDRTGDRLPAYVDRVHDDRLRRLADRAMGGGSALVTLVGGSSTGKTRACWELVRYLERRQPGRWRLWHPYDPTRAEAVAAAIDRVGAHTVVWLNEAQHYLAPPDVRLGERVAAGLRTLLQHADRRPVLVLATLWPRHWSTLTSRPAPADPDPYAQARDLLAGTAVLVADVFTAAELDGAVLTATRLDPRAAAGRRAGGGRPGHPVPGRRAGAGGAVPDGAAGRAGGHPGGDRRPAPRSPAPVAPCAARAGRARLPRRPRLGPACPTRCSASRRSAWCSSTVSPSSLRWTPSLVAVRSAWRGGGPNEARWAARASRYWSVPLMPCRLNRNSRWWVRTARSPRSRLPAAERAAVSLSAV
jgi:hypothetical protein